MPSYLKNFDNKNLEEKWFKIFFDYRTRAIISRGLYFFFTHFSLRLRLILQTIYVLKTEILHFLSLKSAAYKRERLQIESGLWWRAYGKPIHSINPWTSFSWVRSNRVFKGQKPLYFSDDFKHKVPMCRSPALFPPFCHEWIELHYGEQPWAAQWAKYFNLCSKTHAFL